MHLITTLLYLGNKSVSINWIYSTLLFLNIFIDTILSSVSHAKCIRGSV